MHAQGASVHAQGASVHAQGASVRAKELTCTVNISIVNEWILLKFDILLNDNPTQQNKIRSSWTISYVHAHTES